MSSDDPIGCVNVEGWPRPRGYSNGMLLRGTTLLVAGQIGWDENQRFAGDDVVSQFGQALRNVVAVVRAAGGQASHLGRLTIYLTDLDAYRSNLKAIGALYREIIGSHYPAMALIGVAGLLEPRARVEIEATAVIPEQS